MHRSPVNVKLSPGPTVAINVIDQDGSRMTEGFVEVVDLTVFAATNYRS